MAYQLRSKGAIFIAYGNDASVDAHRAQQQFVTLHPDIPTSVVSDFKIFEGDNLYYLPDDNQANFWLSRRAKIELYNLSPYEFTLYMDADTYAYRPLTYYWRLLEREFDIVITPAKQQDDDCLWHVGEPEKQETLDEIGYTPLQLQGGVFAFRRSPACEKFFSAWKREWFRYEGQDQAALLRALQDVPLRIALLSKVYNGGAYLAHAHRIRTYA